MLEVVAHSAQGRVTVTVCPFCGTGCSVLLVDSTAHPRRLHPVTQGALCLRGWSMGELCGSPLRVTGAAMRRRGEPLAPVPVDDALARVVERLRDIRSRHGGESIGILGSARITVEEARLIRRLAGALGTPHLDSFQRMGYVPFPPCGLHDIEEARRITILGADPRQRHPQVGRRVLRALDRGAQVRVVHPKPVSPAGAGAIHRAVAPGREIDCLDDAAPDEFFLVSSELALAGRGHAVAARLANRRALFLTDYANQRGMVEAGIHPSPNGLSAWEMLNAAAQGRLKALVVFADDPFEFFPELAARAFAATEFTVVVDALKTRSARHADVVLPGALLCEKRGTVVNLEGRAQELSPGEAEPAEWTEGWIAERLADTVAGGGDAGGARPFAPGAGGIEPEGPSAEYPFVVALDVASFWDGHALTTATVTAWREARNVLADFPNGHVGMNREDAKALKLSFGTPAAISSADGSISLPVRFDPHAPPGTLWIPMSCWERAGVPLGALDFDPALRIPVFRPRAVRAARAEGKA